MFRKATIAAALSAVAAAPAAYAASEVAIHGDFRGSLDHTSSTNTTGNLNWQDNLSRFGVSASTEVGDLKGFLHYERLVSNDGDTNFDAGLGEETLAFYGGLKTAFGSVYYGQAPTAFRTAAKSIDPFFNTALAAPGPIPNEAPRGGASVGLSLLTADVLGSGYVENTVGYKSPDIMGLRINAAVNIDEASGGSQERHDYSFGVSFAHEGLSTGVQYINTSGDRSNFFTTSNPAHNLFAHASLDLGIASVSAAYQRLQPSNESNVNHYFVSGTLPLNDVMRVAATYGAERPSAANQHTLTGGGVALFYDVLPNFTTYVGARYAKQNTGTPNNLHSEAVAVGVSYSFRVAHSL